MTDQDPSQDGQKPVMSDKDHFAEVRTSLARSRTYLAAERTFSAWIRTGFTIAGAGVTLGTALKNDAHSRVLSLVIGTALISVGIFSFVFAWYDFKKVHDYITSKYEKHELETQSFSFNFLTVTVMAIVLIIASVLGFYMIIT